MTAQHSKASYWIRKGLFDDLGSFASLEARVSDIPEEKDRGDIFEIFIEGYLATQTITQRVSHWVVGSIPLAIRERYNLPRDATGIDGIYETHDGSHVAYQVKFRQKEHLTYAEVAPFLGLTERFSDRVIYTNASALSDKAIQRTRWVSREVFASLSAKSLQGIEAWLKEKPRTALRATPDPRHQVHALSDISATLATSDRATVVMACGTGKTLVALWAAEQQRPKTVLVLLPSLTLLKQTLQQWSEQTSWGSRFTYLCVCSDPTVGLKDDSWNTDKSDVGFRIDTEPNVVRAFLERATDNVKVIFSTYQSSQVVGDGAADLPPIDLAIFDEAHKTTGHSGTAFNYALSDERIRIRKRLFLTATPRHIDIRHRDKEGDFRVHSMDDDRVYGPRAHTLSFAAASKMGIICPFKVVISLIDKEAVTDFAREHGITIVQNDEIGTRWVANLAALARAVDRVRARKIITFHSRVRLAQDFASAGPRGIAHYLDDYDVRHVSGSQSSALRAEVIRAFADAPQSLLTNARCLTEGVDIPAVDMVAFIDPRQSRIDITQAVGRAMRKPRGPSNKTVGYVVVPVFAGLGDEDSTDEAIRSERFDVVADVLNALQEHDEELVDIIREIRERKGAGEPLNPRRLNERLEVIGPHVDLDRLTASIGIELADRLGSSWDEWYGLLTQYRQREGHCRVQMEHREGASRLGRWVGTQRVRIESLSNERRGRLDAIGFEWDLFSADWERAFTALESFKAREDHCRVPREHLEGAFRLGSWASKQRVRIESLSNERKGRLDAIGFEWDPFSVDWERAFTALESFKAREGHCRVPKEHREGAFRLGSWTSSQRTLVESMSTERRERLDAIGFEWDLFSADWERAFTALENFKAREGHCRVHHKHIEDAFRLGSWVGTQRWLVESMSTERRERLDAIGFEWDPFSADWERAFTALESFKAREGHCRVPREHREGAFRLGRWVGTQRRLVESMSTERRGRLDAIGFEWRVNAASGAR